MKPRRGDAVTEQRDLRTGTPFWLRHGDVNVPTRPLTADLTVDVAVVGAGVSGALVADAILSAGRSVAVLDRRGPVKGSTPASTALLQFEIDQPLIHLARRVGYSRAVRAYWRSATAVDALRGRNPRGSGPGVAWSGKQPTRTCICARRSMAAQIIQRAVLGLPDPDADLFALPE